MRALIIEFGRERSALAAARALGRAGWHVGIGSPYRGRLASLSRWAKWHRVPPAEGDPAQFVTALNRAIEADGYELIFPAGDAEILVLNAHRDHLGASFPYTSPEVLMTCLDKLELFKHAQAAGLSVPQTFPLGEAEERAQGRPIVVKASLHSPSGSGTRRLETAIVSEGKAISNAVRLIESKGARPILQEFVPGNLMAYVAVTDRRGHVLAHLQQISEATWPARAGISARARTVPVDSYIADGVGRLLAKLGWFGLAEVQFVAPPEGTPKLIDFNGRFYGSMALALAAGMNLPHIWGAEALGLAVDDPREAKIGVRYQWLEGDALRIRELAGGQRLRALFGSSIYALRAKHSIWDLGDPIPAIAEAGSLVVRRFRRGSS